MNPFADRLTEALAGRNISRVAEACDIHRASLHRYMNGDSTPNLEIAVIIAGELGVTVGWLVGE